MSKTLTIRTDDALRVALERRADRLGLTLSEVAREILREALEERPVGERAGHLRGSLSLPAAHGPWRDRLRERNWRS